jgi:WhiB family redox-sensing transcriptional regulator
MSWRDFALCRGTSPSLFYADRDEDPNFRALVDQARQVCAACPVAGPCGDEAIDRREKHGVWGGMTERDRRRVIRLRAGRPAINQHGTVSGYGDGCRCPDCTAAAIGAQRAYRSAS